MSKSDSFKKGERVQARWAGSKQFYDGKIVEVLKRICKVQFDNDGTVSSVKLSDIKKPGEEVSPKPARSKTRSRSRSTGRTSRSRSRSPARKRKVKKEKTKNERSSGELTEKSSNTNSLARDEVDTVKIPLTREKLGLQNLSPVRKVNSITTKETSSVLKEEITVEGRSTRLSALRSMEMTQRLLDQKRERNAKIAGKTKYSDDEDEEEEEEEKSKSASKKLSKAWQSFYFVSTVLKIILLPGVILFLIFACNSKQCTILEVPNFYTRWTTRINAIKIPLAVVAVFHLLLSLIPLLPLGKLKLGKKVTGFSTSDSKTPPEYQIYGFNCFLICSLIFGSFVYYGANMNMGYDKFKPLALSSLIYCTSVSLILFLYHKFKRHGLVQSAVPFIGNFYYGSFTNPILFGKIDIKTSFVHAGLIGSVLLNLSILTKYILAKGSTAIPLGMTSTMQIFFVASLLYCEENLLSTATYTSDSVGYAFILIFGLLIPFGLSTQNVYHYLYETKTSLTSYWYYSAVAVIVLLYFIGYYLYFLSSNLKHRFRRDPYGKSMLKYDSVPTQIKSKRLLLSGGWGFVRHPNYLGLLIMAIAWTLPCGYTHAVPYGPLAMLVIALIFRIFRIEKECQQKYGPGWKNYTEKVRSRLIPYIF